MACLIIGEKHILFDDADYALIAQGTWSIAGTGYAYGRIQVNGIVQKALMHRIIMDAPDHLDVDHINGNRLDNRRCNLRLATTSENMCNRGASRNSNTPYKGVHYRKDRGIYQAYITKDRKRLRLGNFRDAESAARAHDLAATEHHGEFAFLNFPGEPLWTPQRINEARRNPNKTSRYRGVSWTRANEKWEVKIKVNYESKNIGYFESEIDAAKAYNEAAVKYHGDRAKLNELA